MKHLQLDRQAKKPPTRDHPHGKQLQEALPKAIQTRTHPTKSGNENASIFFVGNATMILEWEGIRLMTDASCPYHLQSVSTNRAVKPNFLHAGDHVHLGPGVTSIRRHDPGVDLHDLPNIDVVLLSHYHEDHFDKEVEASLRRDLPIISTPHAKAHLTAKGPGEDFSNVHELDFFESMIVDIVPGSESHSAGTERPGKTPSIKVTGMPGKHVPDGVLGTVNEFLKAVPPTNGWMVELGYGKTPGADESFECGYRIYISGDTLMVDELNQIPERYRGQNIDLMLIHLGGTTIPGPSMPLLMVTMDAKQGLELVQLINPDLTIPIHFDDYDVMLSPLSDFKKAMEEAGLSQKVVYLDRKDQYTFNVKSTT